MRAFAFGEAHHQHGGGAELGDAFGQKRGESFFGGVEKFHRIGNTRRVGANGGLKPKGGMANICRSFDSFSANMA